MLKTKLSYVPVIRVWISQERFNSPEIELLMKPINQERQILLTVLLVIPHKLLATLRYYLLEISWHNHFCIFIIHLIYQLRE
jgi:hypothetical protein